jgi:SlyX protein
MSQTNDNLQLHIIELESKLAFQEDTVQSLSNELLEHHKRLEQLQLQIKILAEKVQQIPDDMGILRPEEEPLPPHY